MTPAERKAALDAHLQSGATTLCHCWSVERRDGWIRGFTDHDRDLVFEGITFHADTGLAASAMARTLGLSVDNTEASGLLRDAAITDADILAGRFDGAKVHAWRVNWANPEARRLVFAGEFGEVRRTGEAFTVELRGLSERLNDTIGLAYHRNCGAALGDARCGFDLATPGYVAEVPAETVESGRRFMFTSLGAFDERWFEGGAMRILSGAAEGLVGHIKNDRIHPDGRRMLELWEPPAVEIRPGDSLRIEPGCDKRSETCRLKFNNFLNFRGFPHLPGDDWLLRYPSADEPNDGGSLA